MHDLATCDHRAHHHMLAHLLLLLGGELRVFRLDHLRNEHLVQHFGVDGSRNGLRHGVITENGRLQIIDVLLDDLLHAVGRRAFESLDADFTLWRVFTILLGLELDHRSQHLLHQQRAGDGFQHVVHGQSHVRLLGVGLGDQVGELSVFLAHAVTRAAPDDLDHFRQ